ncbi:hypothetical protein LCGC14_0686260 [marine sediment metagenome]|uniref:BppU N-terminal domain-containing protein n=1 Tax=marine sediment metagenome TaxID=412755 RepID=A0A0F9QRM1_9ZZZZ
MSQCQTFNFQAGQVRARIILAVKTRDPITQLLSALDLSAATQFDVTIKKPSGGKVTYLSGPGEVIFTPPPDGTGDGTDGLIEAATLLATDLDEAGTYLVQAEITDAGIDGFTQVGSFTVGANL